MPHDLACLYALTSGQLMEDLNDEVPFPRHGEHWEEDDDDQLEPELQGLFGGYLTGVPFCSRAV